jgi:hypothetical protein
LILRSDPRQLPRVKVLAIALAALVLSCAPPPPSAPVQPVHTAAVPAPPAAPTAPPEPRLSITLRPLIEPTPRIHVEVVAEGDGTDLRTWRVDAATLVALLDLAVRDDDGPVPFLRLTEGGTGLTLARTSRGPVHVSYDVAATRDAAGSPLATMVVPTAMRAAGEALLLLPVAYDEKPVPTALHIEAEALGASGAASSLGIGASREQTVRGRFLRHGAFIAGQLGTAVFHIMEADDEAAWIGVTAFDPRAAASEAAIVRGVVETFFGGHEVGPMPLLIVGHVTPQRLMSMSRRSNSMLLNVGMAEPWGAAPRIAVAHPIVQKWIGGAVWVGPDDAAHEAESYWFSEGVARFFAREILFRVGLLEPDELRDSIAGDLATLYTSPRRGERNAALAAHVESEGAMALLVARGSLYALGVNARIRAHTERKKSLDAVMLALLRDAREGHRRVLPASAWIDALKGELGDEEARIFEQAIVLGLPPPIPADALGPCFRRAEGRYARYDLGFDEPATKAAAGHAIAGLARGGPAARAGVRAGDVLVRASFEPGWAQGPATLELTREGKALTVTYLPAGEGVPGPVWVRLRAVPTEKCKP